MSGTPYLNLEFLDLDMERTGLTLERFRQTLEKLPRDAGTQLRWEHYAEPPFDYHVLGEHRDGNLLSFTILVSRSSMDTEFEPVHESYDLVALQVGQNSANDLSSLLLSMLGWFRYVGVENEGRFLPNGLSFHHLSSQCTWIRDLPKGFLLACDQGADNLIHLGIWRSDDPRSDSMIELEDNDIELEETTAHILPGNSSVEVRLQGFSRTDMLLRNIIVARGSFQLNGTKYVLYIQEAASERTSTQANEQALERLIDLDSVRLVLQNLLEFPKPSEIGAGL